jgi:hypothetical protein
MALKRVVEMACSRAESSAAWKADEWAGPKDVLRGGSQAANWADSMAGQKVSRKDASLAARKAGCSVWKPVVKMADWKVALRVVSKVDRWADSTVASLVVLTDVLWVA